MNQHDHRIDIDHELAPPDRLEAHHRRQLSAMLDGELSPDQARFMLRRLQHDHELAARWERWQVCGDVLRGHGHALLPPDFSQRVAAAIVSPASAAAGQGTTASAGHPQRRLAMRPNALVRWGGGALAASVALVALFMARPLPDAASPGLAGGAADPVAAMALAVDDGPAARPTSGAMAALPADGDAGTMPGAGDDAAAALLASVTPAALAVAEVPRRAAERSGSRGQSQRAALRRSQAVAAAPAPVQAVPAPLVEGDALFGNAPDAVARPWPRAVLPGLGRPSYAAGYGLPQPQPEAFAPFQPRFDIPADRALRGPAALPAAQDVPAAATTPPTAAPVPGAGPVPSE